MEEFKIKKGTTFETTDDILVDGTLLQVKDFDDLTITFNEFYYNVETNEYDILIDDNRILSYNEVKKLLQRSYGKNYKIVLDE